MAFCHRHQGAQIARLAVICDFATESVADGRYPNPGRRLRQDCSMLPRGCKSYPAMLHQPEGIGAVKRVLKRDLSREMEPMCGVEPETYA